MCHDRYFFLPGAARRFKQRSLCGAVCAPASGYINETNARTLKVSPPGLSPHSPHSSLSSLQRPFTHSYLGHTRCLQPPFNLTPISTNPLSSERNPNIRQFSFHSTEGGNFQARTETGLETTRKVSVSFVSVLEVSEPSVIVRSVRGARLFLYYIYNKKLCELTVVDRRLLLTTYRVNL